MARQSEAKTLFVTYLSNIANNYKCAVGLILGQISMKTFYIDYLAKTPPFQSEQDKNEGKPSKPIRSIQEVNESWMADHAKHATRMLPGGMYVLGVFAVTDEDILNPLSPKIKSILNALEKNLAAQPYLFGTGCNDKIVLHFCSKTHKYSAKIYDVVTLRVYPMDIKVVEEGMKLVNFLCTYQIDQIYHLRQNETSGPLRKHIKVMLDGINSKLEDGIILFDNEAKEFDDKIENLGKKRKRISTSKVDNSESSKPTGVTIFEKCVPIGDQIVPTSIGGQIRVVGEVVSQFWISSKSTFREAVRAVKEDIMRSLSTRMEMHWDSLTEEELSEDINSVHEPPRRVLITLPESNITVSDYLFPGEGPEDSKMSLEEILDVKSYGHLDFLDLEGQADISQYYKETSAPQTRSEDFLPTIAADSNRVMYLIGLSGALLILVVSLLLHYMEV
ncbi:protein odr-4 homolog [Euwallacea fornicatus]|uniref:protein odr-4 homolog n=1 Tax=Euwallacea fornicatus TaxID=995702 RepID=UPI00338D4D7D